MPIESNRNDPTTATTTVPAIENELPAYRAISAGAVVALLLGVLSILSFASWTFLALAVGAIVIGGLADRKIQRFPDALTGRGLAQAGIGLGLAFGLAAVTTSLVQDAIRVNQAQAFAQVYQGVLRNGTLSQAVWYGQAPSIRVNYEPDALYKELNKGGMVPDSFSNRITGLRNLKSALDEPGADLHFERVENHGEQELIPFAGLVYEVHTPQAKNPADRERYALVVAKGDRKRPGRLEWWADDVVFPYKPKTFVAPPRVAKDDGHGHSH